MAIRLSVNGKEAAIGTLDTTPLKALHGCRARIQGYWLASSKMCNKDKHQNAASNTNGEIILTNRIQNISILPIFPSKN